MAAEASSAPNPASPSSSSPPSPSPSPSLRHPIRRQTTQDRLDAILSTARQRAESLTAARSVPGPGPSSRSVPMEPLLRNASAPGTLAGGGAAAVSEHESSADETTGIVSAPRFRGSAARQPNYLSTATASSEGLRSRRGPSRTSAETGPDEAATPTPTGPWWKTLLAGVRSLELENKGSVARDHLALERTFLAWLRTSLSFASIGIAVTQLFRLNVSERDDGTDDDGNRATLRHLGRPLGITFLAISILVLALGYHRYYQSQQWIVRGKFPASRGTILLLSLVAFSLIVASLVVVVIVKPAP